MEGEHQFCNEVWLRAVRFADTYVQRRAPITKIFGCSLVMAQFADPEVLAVSQQYCQAAARIEVYTAFSAGINSRDVVSFIGRGGFPRASLKPIVHR